MIDCACRGPEYLHLHHYAPKPRIFLDLDGVLADFDSAANKALNGECHYRYDFIHGGDALWARLNAEPDFFASFNKMPGADTLWAAVRHLEPTILTALPTTGAWKVDEQKRRWVAKNLGHRVGVITCKTKDKPNYCRPGDILVDDRSINKARWEAAGGTFILHTSAVHTVATLKRLGRI